MVNGDFRVSAPHFVAGGELDEFQFATRVANILYYMQGWSIDEIVSYCNKKGWTIQYEEAYDISDEDPVF